MKTLLINEADISAFTDIGVGYNSTDLSNAIVKAQERELRPILGKKLYDVFIAAIDNGNALADNYQTLLDDYIFKFLIHASYANVLESIFLKPRSNGLGQPVASSGFTPASQQLYNTKRDSVQSDMDHYGNKLVEYLNKNTDLFAEITASTDLDSDEADLSRQRNRSPFITRSKRSSNGRY